MSFEKLEQEHNLINRLLIASGVSPVPADFNVIKIYSLLENFYEHAFLEGMTKQAQSSVDRAVNAMGKPWISLTDEEIHDFDKKLRDNGDYCSLNFAWGISAKLKDKNT
jgi:hypothetical protein